MELSIPKLVLILIVALIVFGGGRIPKIMGDLGKGLKEFKKNMADTDNDPPAKNSRKKSSRKKS